jgi:hypothetical protein
MWGKDGPKKQKMDDTTGEETPKEDKKQQKTKLHSAACEAGACGLSHVPGGRKPPGTLGPSLKSCCWCACLSLD